MTFINLLVEPALHGDIWEDTFHRVMRDLTLSQEPNCFKLNHYFPSYVYDEAGRMRENLVKRQRSIEHSAETLQRELMRYRSDHSEVTSYIAAHIEAKQAVPLRFDVSKIRETWHDLITLDRRMDTFRRCGYYEDAEVHSLAHGLDHAMNWLLDALDVLRTNYGRITEARAQFTPIFRLNDDVLSIVFELLADAEAPTLYRLGWFKLTHVCSAWRRVLLGMSRLWARDAYVYGTSIASSYLLSHSIQDQNLALDLSDSGNISAL
ncbi:hypothetical protein PENSPDRAFT_684837 [Peniophora sp. CONT]|nr:hypothetical protein PENSPDRAFT_684837 [Peniophora sp. CONT]